MSKSLNRLANKGWRLLYTITVSTDATVKPSELMEAQWDWLDRCARLLFGRHGRRGYFKTPSRLRTALHEAINNVDGDGPQAMRQQLIKEGLL